MMMMMTTTMMTMMTTMMMIFIIITIIIIIIIIIKPYTQFASVSEGSQFQYATEHANLKKYAITFVGFTELI